MKALRGVGEFANVAEAIYGNDHLTGDHGVEGSRLHVLSNDGGTRGSKTNLEEAADLENCLLEEDCLVVLRLTVLLAV